MGIEKYLEEWKEKITLVENHKELLNEWERDFVNNVSGLLNDSRPISFRQSKTLRRIHSMVSNRLG